jgi:hypothetical protein
MMYDGLGGVYHTSRSVGRAGLGIPEEWREVSNGICDRGTWDEVGPTPVVLQGEAGNKMK